MQCSKSEGLKKRLLFISVSRAVPVRRAGAHCCSCSSSKPVYVSCQALVYTKSQSTQFVNSQGRLWCQGHTHAHPPAPLQDEWETLNYLNLALRGASTSQTQSCQLNVPWDVSLHIGVTSLAGLVRLKHWELPVSSPAAHSSRPSPSPALGGSSCLITELEASMREGASMP